jgi:hypothetical protein
VILAFKGLKGQTFWTSGTDKDCSGKYRWCSMDKDLIPAEINWKKGHPKGGCTSIEMQYTTNATVMATADCSEEKQFLCEVFVKKQLLYVLTLFSTG